MAGSEEDSIRDLLKAYIPREEDLRDIVEKVVEDGLNVHTLITISDSDLDDLILHYFPVGSSRGAKLGFKTAIRRRREPTHEGARPSKKAKPLSLAARTSARSRYFENLLEPPAELPESVNQLRGFLSLTPVKLPVLHELTMETLCQPKLVVRDTSEGAIQLATFCESVFETMNHALPDNEATSSHELSYLTGNFLRFLNDKAPENKHLRGLHFRLDSANHTTISATSQPLVSLKRPDFQLFVRNCLILRWENKLDKGLLEKAAHENCSKLKAWSPLFYSKLPYVIGGCCAGRRFQWLKLFPKGEKIGCEIISDEFDLNSLCSVAKFLHSTIRMHCLLQKLQEKIDNEIHAELYLPKEKAGVVVTFYPDRVAKKIPGVKKDEIKLLYDSIAGSSYLIQLISYRTSRGGTVLQLQPVGDPFADPRDCKDLENATHDMLHGLADLHGKGYTHRDLRWDNCIKINDNSHWKWVIIDLEAAGPDNEVWVDKWLTGWDAETLEEDNDKRKRYTKGSDMYQLGKLIAGWLDDFSVGGKEERQVMISRAKQMQQERTAASKVLEDVCKKGCERCRMFGTKL